MQRDDKDVKSRTNVYKQSKQTYIHKRSKEVHNYITDMNGEW